MLIVFYGINDVIIIERFPESRTVNNIFEKEVIIKLGEKGSKNGSGEKRQRFCPQLTL